MAVTGLRLRRWRSIGLNLTAAAAEGSVALLFTALADIRPQEAEANLNGKQEEKKKKFADTADSVFYFLSQMFYSLSRFLIGHSSCPGVFPE